MHIALAFDLKFVRFAMATMASVAEHGAPAGERLCWWLMPAADVPAGTLDVVTEWAAKHGEVNILRVPAELDDLPLSSWRIMSSRISNAAYYRLLLPDLVPESVERMLWLDADLICTGDLSELWHTDLGDALLAAVYDPSCATVSAAGGIPAYEPEKYRLEFWSDYFNSGVLLMDLARCREADISGKSLAYIREHAAKLRFAVQDAMNLAVDDRWKRLDIRWNDVDITGYEKRTDADRDPRILHFAGRRKPWQDDYPDGEIKSRYQVYLQNAAELEQQ
jgi:lipopolysaccharide biosynthesis glycosyltransferase